MMGIFTNGVPHCFAKTPKWEPNPAILSEISAKGREKTQFLHLMEKWLITPDFASSPSSLCSTQEEGEVRYEIVRN